MSGYSRTKSEENSLKWRVFDVFRRVFEGVVEGTVVLCLIFRRSGRDLGHLPQG